MTHQYNSKTSSQSYIDFLASPNGTIFRQVIFKAISSRLKNNPDAMVLDAACGTGWLTNELSKTHKNISGFDASEQLIDHAKKQNPHINFIVADLLKPLPYSENQLDAVVLSMAIHDVDDQLAALTNVKKILKKSGTVVATIVNPYYGWPVGAWKRGKIGFLLRKLPKLKFLNFYNRLAANDDKNFSWKENLTSKFHPLSTHLNNFIASGFKLTYYEDIRSDTDSKNFDLNYQLYRFPIIVLMEFVKE